jgi:hypothetical protein
LSAPSAKTSEKRLLRPTYGTFLYIVSARSGDQEWVKVGISRELMGRMQSIQCGCPIPVYKVRYFEIEDRKVAEWAEQAIHAALHEHRTAGEWFAVSFCEDISERISQACSRFIHAIEWKELDRSCMVRDKFEAVGRNVARRAEKLAAAIDEDRSRPREKIRLPDVPLKEALSCYRS